MASATEITELQALCTSIATALAEYAAELATEALNPKPTYRIDGKEVDYNQWRDSIVKAMNGLQASYIQAKKILNQLQPYVVRTKVVL